MVDVDQETVTRRPGDRLKALALISLAPQTPGGRIRPAHSHIGASLA
jgi:hypothetical protein